MLRTPRISNFTDLEPLAAEPDVAVRFVSRPEELTGADLIVVPGSRAVAADLAWLRATGLAAAVLRSDALVLGICGGYQMLGATIVDEHGVEGEPGGTAGLGLLPVTTRLTPDKITRVRHGRALGCDVGAYEIRHGRPIRTMGDGWIELDDERGTEAEGAVSGDRVFGTSLHGLFENDDFRGAFLTKAAARTGCAFSPAAESFAAARARFHDAVADAIEASLDVDRIAALIGAAAPVPVVSG